MRTALRDIECFVFDMDGTINLGDTLIDGALELVQLLRQREIKFFFFTNNSSKSPSAYVQKLERLGFSEMTEEHIITSGDVMIRFLKEKYAAPSVFLVGTPALEEQFDLAGIKRLDCEVEKADAVVVGFDTTLVYEKLVTACRLVAAGTPFYATNIDRICPLEGGAFLPDCASICALVQHATGVPAIFVGKPAAETVSYILAASGKSAAKTALVGDRLYTDIATAVAGNATGIAVLSGEISREDIESQSEIKPDYIFESVKELYEALR